MDGELKNPQYAPSDSILSSSIVVVSLPLLGVHELTIRHGLKPAAFFWVRLSEGMVGKYMMLHNEACRWQLGLSGHVLWDSVAQSLGRSPCGGSPW